MLWRLGVVVFVVEMKLGGNAVDVDETANVRAAAAVPAGITAPVIGLVPPTGMMNVPGFCVVESEMLFCENSGYWIFAWCMKFASAKTFNFPLVAPA